MTDIFKDFDFSDPSLNAHDDPFDPYFGINFSDIFDAQVSNEFESRLAQDFPVKAVPTQNDPVQQDLSGIEGLDYTSQQPRSLISSIPEASDTQDVQPPSFINPTQLYNVPPAPAVSAPPDMANDFEGKWLLNAQKLLTNQLVYNPSCNHTQTLPSTHIDSQQGFFPHSSPVPWLVQLPPQPHPIPPKRDVAVGRRRQSYVPPPLQRSRHSKQPPLPETVTTSPAVKRPHTDQNGEFLSNDKIPRKTHAKKGPVTVEPERYYGPSPPKPRSWGPKNKRGQHLFTYTEKGELSAGLVFTAREMRQYLLGPNWNDGENFEGPYRLPGVKYLKKKIRQGLTLWIGWPATMANARYPRGGESTKCRFKSCRYSHTISVGDPWVIMDERQNTDGEVINPFHNAGYCHLFCLEYYFDIIDLWHCVDVRADYRAFKRETYSYFSLETKLPGIDKALREWWASAYENWLAAGLCGQKRLRTHKTSLAQRLVEYKILNESPTLARSRRKRGGVDITKHRGNPELKRQLILYRKYGLLDDRGCPLPNAEALYEAMESSSGRQIESNQSDPITECSSKRRRQSRKSRANSNVSSTVQFPLPSPLFSHRPFDLVNNSQHLQGHGPQPTEEELDPMMSRAPSIMPASGGADTIPTNGLPAQTAGQKHRLDDDAVEDVNLVAGEPVVQVHQEEPPPKRQRVGEMASDIPLVATEAIRDASFGCDPETEAALIEELFGGSGAVLENGGLSSDANDHVDGDPAPATPSFAHREEGYNWDDDIDALFGEPE